MKVKDAEYVCDRCEAEIDHGNPRAVGFFHTTDILRGIPDRHLCEACQRSLRSLIEQFYQSGTWEHEHDPRYVAGRQQALIEMGEQAARLLGLEPPEADIDHLVLEESP